MKKLIILLFLISTSVYSQVTLNWSKTYNGPANGQDDPADICVDASGNVYTSGISTNASGKFDIAVVKYDASGNQLWVSRYTNCVERKSVLDNQGNLYVAGYKDTNTTMAPLVIKFDNNGNVLWSIKLTASQYFGTFEDIEFNNGSIFASGSTYDSLVVLKINPAGSVVWYTNYKYPGSIYGTFSNKIIFDNNGNIISCGYADMATNNGPDALLLKFNPSGVLQWADKYGIAGISDSWSDVTTDENRNIYVTGNTQNSQLFACALTRKYSPSGNVSWTVIGAPSSRSTFIKLDNCNNVYISGYWELSTTVNGSGIKKFNNNGQEQWVKIQQITNASEWPRNILIDNYNNIYQCKTFNGYTGSNAYTKVIKYNLNGDILWTVTKQGNIIMGSEAGIGIITTDVLNNVYLAATGLGSIDLNDYYTLKYSQSFFTVSGTVKYKDNNQSVNNGFVKALMYDQTTSTIITVDSTVINPDGTYTLTHMPQDSTDLMYYQNDDNLDFVPTYYVSTVDYRQATKIYADHNLTNINGLVYRINNTTNPYNITGLTTHLTDQGQAPINDVIIYAQTGSVYKNYGISDGNGTYTVTKLPNGTYTLWAYRFGFAPLSQNVTVTNGNVSNISFNFGTPIGIEPISSIIPSNFKLYQNYPNPFNPETKIKFDIPKDGNVKIVIYDIMGREVNKLADENLKAGTYSVTWNASDYSSGVYFYRIITEQFTETKKLMLIK